MDDLTRELQHRDTEPDDARSTPKRSGLKRILGLSLGAILILAMIVGGVVYWLDSDLSFAHTSAASPFFALSSTPPVA